MIKSFHEVKNQHGTTEFVGYNQLSIEAKLLKLIETDSHRLAVFDKTPFYGESGGQAGDRGQISFAKNSLAEIVDTQKPVDGLFVHVLEGGASLKEGETYALEVDRTNRTATTRNHSATHLLQAALIEVLGDHVKQAGSFVEAERLRFDFTHMKALTEQEIEKIETLVNLKVSEALPVEANVMTMDQAIQGGAMALFGEKYGDEVRVLDMGDFSKELCGGTHVTNTNEIGLFSIISESSLSSGVRRIEAVSSLNAIRRLQSRSETLKKLELMTSVKGDQVISKFESLQKDLKGKTKRDQRAH